MNICDVAPGPLRCLVDVGDVHLKFTGFGHTRVSKTHSNCLERIKRTFPWTYKKEKKGEKCAKLKGPGNRAGMRLPALGITGNEDVCTPQVPYMQSEGNGGGSAAGIFFAGQINGDSQLNKRGITKKRERPIKLSSLSAHPTLDGKCKKKNRYEVVP